MSSYPGDEHFDYERDKVARQKATETRSLSLRDLIEHELRHHESCLPTPGTVTVCRAEQTIGFHRGLHWVLDALRAQEPVQDHPSHCLCDGCVCSCHGERVCPKSKGAGPKAQAPGVK